jgi:hypothetical protein
VANPLNLFRNGAVGFIAWLGGVHSKDLVRLSTALSASVLYVVNPSCTGSSTVSTSPSCKR